MNTFEVFELTEMTVTLKSQEDYNLQVLRGKVIVNEEDHSLSFEQNAPPGPRSAEVMCTPHSRLVRQPNGRLSLRFRFSENEPGIGFQLLCELKAILSTLDITSKKHAA